MIIRKGEEHMKWLIKNGTIASEEKTFLADLLLEDDKIIKIDTNIEDAEAKCIDAEGCYVMPGAVDIHTHMDLDVGIARAIDDFYTGTIAAACGGTTTIIDHMAFGPKGCNLMHQVKEYHKLADHNAVVDYGFHGVFQHVNDDILKEMKKVVKDEGITSFKIYMTYDYKLSDEDIVRVLKQAKEDGILITVHCENDGIVSYFRKKFVGGGKTEVRYHPLSRPNEAEAEAVNRMLYLASAIGDAPVYIVHLSTKEGLEEIRQAKKRGQKHIGVETCPQYLLLTDDLYDDSSEGLKAVMAPPLRKPADNESLWDGLKNNEIDTVATDHCPFTFKRQKQQGADDFTKCPSGAPGVEERLSLLYSEGVCKGKISMEQLVKYACTNPAKVGGVYPQKGTLSVGSDADIVIFNPKKKWTMTKKKMYGAADYTCYEGREIEGKIDLVMQRGKILVKDGEFLGERGDGKYLKRGKSSIV